MSLQRVVNAQNECGHPLRSKGVGTISTLPSQPHYYLVSDGVRYAKFRMRQYSGLHVFTLLANAVQFVIAIGGGEFQPVKVTAEELLPILMENGGQLLADYLTEDNDDD